MMHIAAYPLEEYRRVKLARTSVDTFQFASLDDPGGTVVEIRQRHQRMSTFDKKKKTAASKRASFRREVKKVRGEEKERDGNRRIRWLFAERSKGQREGGRGRVAARVGDYGEGAAPRRKGTKGGIAAEFEEEGRRAAESERVKS